MPDSVPQAPDSGDLAAVAAECDRLYHAMYADADADFMAWACNGMAEIFAGGYRDYLPLDTPYHDREHTLHGLLCLVRLLHARARVGARPAVSRRGFELAVLAILLHDSGYLKRAADSQGTGAKYTLEHVERGQAFAAHWLTEQQLTGTQIDTVQTLIAGTALPAAPADLPCVSAETRILAAAVASADLLGQMAADDYIERLPQLFEEFSECWRHAGERAAGLHYANSATLIAGTPHFWENCVKPKLETGCLGAYRFLSVPYPDGDNVYLQRIEANLAKIPLR